LIGSEDIFVITKKDTPIRTIRDSAAFHYDKLNLEQAIINLPHEERRLYLAQHPANALYYAGSALVFSTVFAVIADGAIDTKNMTHIERMDIGVRITVDDLNVVNLRLHSLLYGLIAPFVETIEAATPGVEQMRVQVFDAPKPTIGGSTHVY
jgi:hypothetical protein